MALFLFRRVPAFTRSFHCARPAFVRAPEKAWQQDPFSIDEQETYDHGPTSFGWEVQRQEREVLNIMRMIERDSPKLRAFRQPFNPPSPAEFVVVRSISYGREEHPVTAKRTIVVPVSLLPLPSPAAIHKFKLIAGVRWTSEPPADSGIAKGESGGDLGYVKISCEDFPEGQMNLKWASDVLDEMIEQANNTRDKFEDIPFDSRHLESRRRKKRRGAHSRSLLRPSIADFPKDWLPVRS